PPPPSPPLPYPTLFRSLHKTFTTPHGGGGPGAGPICFTDALEPFAPSPVLYRDGDRFGLDHDRPQSIGRMRAFQGNFGMFIRARSEEHTSELQSRENLV